VLAMGKPTIATKTKAMEMFKEHVYLGATKEDYISLTEKALEENSKELSEKRANFAKSHTWQNNVSAIYEAIKKQPNNFNMGLKKNKIE
jgi:galactokinase